MVFALSWKLVFARCVSSVCSDNKWTNWGRLGASNEIFTIKMEFIFETKWKWQIDRTSNVDTGPRQVKLTRAKPTSDDFRCVWLTMQFHFRCPNSQKTRNRAAYFVCSELKDNKMTLRPDDDVHMVATCECMKRLFYFPRTAGSCPPKCTNCAFIIKRS